MGRSLTWCDCGSCHPVPLNHEVLVDPAFDVPHRLTDGRELPGQPAERRKAGAVHGGDRLPWVKTDANGIAPDNFTPLTSLDWQVHMYGDAATAIQEDMQGAANWRCMCCRVARGDGVAPVCAAMPSYLVRPDGYVGTGGLCSGAAALASYLDARKITANNAMRDPRSRASSNQTE